MQSSLDAHAYTRGYLNILDKERVRSTREASSFFAKRRSGEIGAKRTRETRIARYFLINIERERDGNSVGRNRLVSVSLEH